MQDNNFKFSCMTIESIRLMAEGANLPEPSAEVAASLSEDATFKLKRIIIRAQRFMEHSNRSKLTCADINKALRWFNSQPVFGYECNPNQPMKLSYSNEAHVFVYDSEAVDLEQRLENAANDLNRLNMQQLDEANPELTLEQCHTIRLDCSKYILGVEGTNKTEPSD